MTEAPIGVGSEMSQKITFLSESLLTVSLSANEWSLTSVESLVDFESTSS